MSWVVQLGKYGDVINILPFAYMMSRQLGKVNWLIGKPWASILEGVSYVNPIVFDGTDDNLQAALNQFRGRQLWVTQCWRNPDQTKVTDSFSKEQWRYVNALHERGKWPLVFDKRDAKREQDLVDTFIQKDRRNVLVGTTSVSTPYRHAAKLLDEIYRNVDANIIPLDKVYAHRLYDLIALYDAADLMVTVDTCHVHLARASQCPVIFLRNDLKILGEPGWNGADPPPQTIASWGYNELGDDLSPVVDAAQKHLDRKSESMAVVIHSYDPTTDRHKRCMPTHPRDAIYVKPKGYQTVKTYLRRGMDENKDVVVFTNDDVAFPDGSLEKIRRHAQKWNYGCSRRPRNPTHIGREIFWFRTDWLRTHFEALPDAYWGVQKPDLIFAKYLRKLRGVPTTLTNLNYDFPPVELPAGIITHEDHPSHWAVGRIENSPEGQANERIWASL